MVTTKAAGRAGNAAEALAARLAEAERAEEGPRRNANKLEAELAAAVVAERFGDAEELKGELHEARSELALAEAATRALRDGQAVVERERQAAEQAVQEARQRAEAQRAVDAAQAAGQQARDTIDSALGVMREHFAAAGEAYRRALAAEGAASAAAQQEHQARRAAGEEVSRYVTGGSNAASVLRDTDPLVQALVRWRP